MDTSLNIVALIENNPITQLSSTYQNKLLIKIKENFTDTQQKLFVSSFYCYLNYNEDKDFVIDLDNIWEWLGFQQKYHAKVVLEKNFILDKNYIVLLPNAREQKKEGRGGHNIKKIMMTINTFKLLCLKSDTKKASEIHEYYIKLEKMLNQTIKEECSEYKLKLQQEKNEKNQLKNEIEENKKDFEEKIKNEKILQKEQVLLKKYSAIGPIVYIIKVKTIEDGKYIFKIVESRLGIEGRYTEHKKNYPECVLLDCYSVIKSKEFENFIHSNEKIRIHKVKDLQGHEKENELFLIGKELTYKILTKVIDDNIKHFNEYTKKDFDLLEAKYDLLETKYNLLQQQISLNNPSQTPSFLPSGSTPEFMRIATSSYEDSTILKILNENSLFEKMMIQIEEYQNQNNIKLETLEKLIKESLQKPQQPPQKILTGFQQPNQTIGPRLQKINPENLSLIKIYETVSEALQESNHKLKRPSIQKAIVENTVYQGFRWAYKERNEDPNEVNVPPTRHTQVQNVGYIAKLNNDKTEIIQVYIDRKTASLQNGYTSASALDIPVKREKPVNGYFYMLFDKCPENVQEDFIQNKGVPILYKEGIGQFDHNTHLVQEFTCKYDCIKKLQMSEKTLAKTLNKDIAYNQYYYRKLPEKLVC